MTTRHVGWTENRQHCWFIKRKQVSKSVSSQSDLFQNQIHHRKQENWYTSLSFITLIRLVRTIVVSHAKLSFDLTRHRIMHPESVSRGLHRSRHLASAVFSYHRSVFSKAVPDFNVVLATGRIAFWEIKICELERYRAILLGRRDMPLAILFAGWIWFTIHAMANGCAFSYRSWWFCRVYST